MIKYKTGDLIELAHTFDVIAHGCNCYHTMGAGIAYYIKEAFPEAYYEADCNTPYGDKNKLGWYSSYSYSDLTVVNLYTQFSAGGTRAVDYTAVRKCMKALKNTFSGYTIGLPKIGAGLGGGDWSVIEKIIEEELDGEDVTVVVFE